MGWAAYQFKRSTGGTINIFVPKLATPITVPRGSNVTLARLLEIPDFPIEAHVFGYGAGAEEAVKFGFPHVINTKDYGGETWTLDNGATIKFYKNSAQIDYTFPDGSSPGSGFGDTYGIEWFPAVIDEGTISGKPYKNLEGFWYPRVETEDSGGFFWYGGTFPGSPLRLSKFYKDAAPVYISSDPYAGGGESGPGGGTGDFDNTSDKIEIPDVPTISAASAGFITLFNPTMAELNNLASYMWSDLFDINGWKKVFADPMQAILGLSIVPVNVPAATSKPVKVGNISTDVSMTVAASQYVTVDCGTLNVNEFWGAYLDYDPFTKAEIYLPYIGIHSLATDDIMGRAIHVVYHVDILSGSCCAYVKCGGSVLYSFVGQCSSSVPITGDNWTNVINGALSIAGSIGSMVATGGASAPSAIGNIASTAVNSMKPSIEKSGSMGGTGGMLGIQTPYLILTRPRQAVPRDQNKYIGYPSFITAKLSDLSGYTEVDSIHLENIGATEKELNEIETILKSGVIL